MSSASGNAIPNHAEVAEKILAIVRPKTSFPVTTENSFDSLGLDSLAMAEVVFEIENAFNIRTDDRILDVRTVGQVITFVEKTLRDPKCRK